jgi:hypothetical protein
VVFNINLTKYQAKPVGNNRAIEFGGYTGAGSFYIVPQAATGNIALWVWKADNTGWYATADVIGAADVTSGYHTLAVSWDTSASNYKVWWDGALKATVSGQGVTPGSSSFSLAGHAAGWRFDYDDIKLYSKRLSDAEVTALTGTVLTTDVNTLVRFGYDSTLAGEYNAVTTINRSTSGRKSVVVDRDMFLLGTDDYMEAPDPLDGSLDFDVPDDFTVVEVLRVHPTASSQSTLAKMDYSSGSGWRLQREPTDRVIGKITGTVTNWVEPANGTFPDRTANIVAMRRRVSDDTVAMFVNGISVLSETDTSTSSLANNLPLRIGRHSATGDEYAAMEFIGAAIWKRALTDDEIGYLAGEFGV